MQLHYHIKNRHQLASLASFTGEHARQNKLMNICRYADEMLDNGIITMKAMTRYNKQTNTAQSGDKRLKIW